MAYTNLSYKVIKNRFNRCESKLRQIFCSHKWQSHMEVAPALGVRCIYEKCEKCGKFKEINYIKTR